jgi:hypothetical protein
MTCAAVLYYFFMNNVPNNFGKTDYNFKVVFLVLLSFSYNIIRYGSG